MRSIIGVSGRVRRGSFNTMLLRAASELAPPGVTVDVTSVRGIPLDDGDVEAAEGVPAIVEELKNRIAASDGLLIASPEYNNSIAGVMKNAIAWLSRPPAGIARVFAGRAVAIIGATPGLGGTTAAQVAWLPVLRTLKMLPWFGDRLTVPSAGHVFDFEGRLIDDALRARLGAFVKGFAAFAAQHGPNGPDATRS